MCTPNGAGRQSRPKFGHCDIELLRFQSFCAELWTNMNSYVYTCIQCIYMMYMHMHFYGLPGDYLLSHTFDLKSCTAYATDIVILPGVEADPVSLKELLSRGAPFEIRRVCRFVATMQVLMEHSGVEMCRVSSCVSGVIPWQYAALCSYVMLFKQFCVIFVLETFFVRCWEKQPSWVPALHRGYPPNRNLVQ